MLIKYNDFLEHLIINLLKNDNKLQSYVNKNFKDKDLLDYLLFLKDSDGSLYNTYIDSIKNRYKQFGCCVAEIDTTNDFFGFAINQFEIIGLIDILFSNNYLIDSLKEFLKYNPVKTLYNIPYFKEAILKSLSSYIDDYSALVYQDSLTQMPSLCLNTKEDSRKLNGYFLNDVFTILSSEINPGYDFTITIDNNILSFSYGKTTVNAMLIEDKHLSNLISCFSHKCLDEVSIILDAFFKQDMPYNFAVMYFSVVHKYVNYNTEDIEDWVVEKFNDIKNNSYFLRLSKTYSTAFAVFVNSIYPLGDIADLYKDNPNLNNSICENYSTFSFLSWILEKRKEPI